MDANTPPNSHKHTADRILIALAHAKTGIRQADLPKLIGVSPQHVSIAVKSLKKKSLITTRTLPEKGKPQLFFIRQKVKEANLETLKTAEKLPEKTEKSGCLNHPKSGLFNHPSKTLPSKDLKAISKTTHINTIGIYNSMCGFSTHEENSVFPKNVFLAATPKEISRAKDNLVNDGGQSLAESERSERPGQPLKKEDYSGIVQNVTNYSPTKPQPTNPDYLFAQRAAKQIKTLPPVNPPADLRYRKSEWDLILTESETNVFCYYTGLPPIARDIVFAREWVRQFKAWRPDNGYGKMYAALVDAPDRKIMATNQHWQAWRRARVIADSLGASYNQWCEAIFGYYDTPRFFKVTGETTLQRLKVKPILFAGPKAREIYDLYKDERANRRRIKAAELRTLNPDFLPENYQGTPLQIDFFKRALNEVKHDAECSQFTGDRLKEAMRAAVATNYGGYIPREFAESEHNWLLPGYKHTVLPSPTLAYRRA